MQKLEGLIAAPFAPLDRKGAVIYEKIAAYYDFLKRNNVTGAFINGSTGEGVSLTQSERMKIAEKWVQAAKENPKLKIINLVGGTSYAECIENAQHSAAIGTDAIALLAPYYFKPSGPETLVGFVARVAESVPHMPVYFYHIPALTGCFVPMYDFLKMAAPVIPNLVGIKFTHEDFMDFLSCLHFGEGRFDMLWGRDESLLSALILGTRGGVGSTYNYAAPLYNKLIEAFNQHDFEAARRLQQKSIDMIRLLGKYGGISTGKAFMRYIGMDCGMFRLPVNTINDEVYRQFVEDVNALNMDHLFSKVD